MMTLTLISHAEVGAAARAHRRSTGADGGIHVFNGPTWVSYTNAWGNDGTDWTGVPDPTGASGNLSVDPLWTDLSPFDPADWDLHLQPGSPLIDAGDPSLADPDGTTSDIGPHGGPGGAW